MELKINIVAILVAVVVNFVLGFIWFTPLFGKIWGKEMGYDPNMKPDKKVMFKGMAFMIIGNFLFAWVFAHNIAAWLFVPGIKEMSTSTNAIMSAVFTWLGFYFPGHLGATVWERKSWKLFFISTGYSLASLLVVAFILTYWT
jgi:MFS family permease